MLNANMKVICVHCSNGLTDKSRSRKYCSTKCLILYNSIFISNGCREWQLGKNHCGYGVYRYRERTFSPHRELWVQINGLPLKGLCVCHICDNPVCVNIDHLFLGTRADNMQDMVTKNRHAKTAGVLNPRAILTEDNVREIRAAKKKDGMNIVFAKRFGVCVGTIEAVRSRRGWKGVLDA